MALDNSYKIETVKQNVGLARSGLDMIDNLKIEINKGFGKYLVKIFAPVLHQLPWQYSTRTLLRPQKAQFTQLDGAKTPPIF